MILTRAVILAELAARRLRIEPMSMDQVGPASIDLHLGDEIRIIDVGPPVIDVNDAADFRSVSRVQPLVEPYVLQPGETIRLDRPTTGYVLVRANGSLIGSGHLVEIDGRLGVCLDRLTPPATPPALAQDTDGPQQ